MPPYARSGESCRRGRIIGDGMKKKANAPPDEPEVETVELSKFQQLARALFRVERRDVDKHEPTKRRPPNANVTVE